MRVGWNSGVLCSRLDFVERCFVAGAGVSFDPLRTTTRGIRLCSGLFGFVRVCSGFSLSSHLSLRQARNLKDSSTLLAATVLLRTVDTRRFAMGGS